LHLFPQQPPIALILRIERNRFIRAQPGLIRGGTFEFWFRLGRTTVHPLAGLAGPMHLNRGFHRWARIIQSQNEAVGNGVHRKSDRECDRSPGLALNFLISVNPCNRRLISSDLLRLSLGVNFSVLRTRRTVDARPSRNLSFFS